MKAAGTRNRNYPERQETILRSACGVFVRDGFHAASMKDICAAAGMSPGSVYRYYPSKEALIEALIVSDRTRWLAAISPRSIASETAPQVLSCLIFAAFDGLVLRATFDPALDTRTLTRGFLDFIGRAIGTRPIRKKGSR
jgi:AcrR family transcriptional regulator